MPEIVGRKLRILALHGYAQNALFFNGKTGALRKGLKAVAELHYLEAPHAAGGSFFEIDADTGRGSPRGWWNTDDERRPAVSASYVGLSESLALVDATIASEGPFDGVLGFSQGATLAALLCLTRPTLFSFAICVAGFVPRDAAVAGAFESDAPAAIPTFHCTGETDASVPPEVCRRLAACFVDPVVFSHPGGHVVPGNAPFRNGVKDFLRALPPPAGDAS